MVDQSPDGPGVEVLEDPSQMSPAIRPSFEYWLARRGDDWAPTPTAFRIDALPPKLIPWCVIVDVVAASETGGTDFVYRFWGTGRTRLLGRDLTGQSISELKPDEMRDAIFDEYDEVRRERRPVVSRKRIRLPDTRVARFESVRLPITVDGDTVDRIFATTCYQNLTEDHYRLFGTEAPIFGL